MVFCLAFPCDLEADVSNGILLKILGVIKSTPRSVRGHLEVTHFVTLEGNGVSVTSTKCLGVLWGKTALSRMPQWNQMSHCGSFKHDTVCGCVDAEFLPHNPFSSRFLCLSLGVI